MYIANESDLVISNSISGTNGTKGTNIVIWFQDNLQSNALTMVSNDFYVVTNRGSGTTSYQRTMSPPATPTSYMTPIPL